ncbi:MAG: dipeptide epimerase [Candidatus Omnitrophica bacterium]|nr:dipeptide epimerase [Candidatus Omnitrophota bacterium]
MPMIVKEIAVLPLRAPLVTPFRIATGQHDVLDNILLRIELVDGTPGYGEAAVVEHITGETVPQTMASLKECGAALIGEDIADYRTLLWAFKERFTGNHAALAAFEMAVLDAFTRSMKIPLWSLFGAHPVKLATDITIVIGSLAEAAAGVKAFAARGFRSFKIKVGRDPELDLERVLAVAKCAPKAMIILDANQAFTAEGMLKFLKQLKRQGVVPVLLEQPVKKADWEGLKKLTRCAGMPVCADESVGSLAAASAALKAGVVNAVNVKLMKSGFIEGEAIARLARARGARLMMGAMMESSLAITAGAHFAAGLGCFEFIDLDTTFFIKGPLARSPYLSARGVFDLALARPGIGVQISGR